MDHNEDEIPAVRALAQDLGVDALTFKTLNHCMRDPYKDASAGSDDEFAPHQARYQRFRTDAGGRRIRRRDNPCKHLWNGPSIHWDGHVSPCTFDPQDRHVLGDMARQSFSDIWHGEPYRRIRREFRQGWDAMALCGECSYAYEGGSLSCETIAEAVFFPSFTLASSSSGAAAR